MKRNNPFTLLELILAMGILMVIMVIMLSFFSAAQKAWMTSSANAEIYENARVAMDLMTRDLQASLYNNDNSTKGIYPFWHQSDSRINFISATNVGDASDISNIREVKYARSDEVITPNDLGTPPALKGGWFVRSVTGDFMVDKSSPINTNDRTITDNMYNFTLFPRDYPGDASYTSTMKSQRLYRIFKEINGATVSPFYKSSNDFTYVIPYVVSLKFTCYNSLFKDMRNINGDTVPGTVLNGDAVYDYPITAAATIAAQPTPFPYAIKIDIVLLDRTSWKKWLAMGGNVATPTGSTGDTGTIKTFREAQQRTFSKLIYLGERDTK